MISKLNNTQIEKVLQQQIIGRLGCHADGVTYVVPVSYAYDGTYIYIHSFEGKKLDMMRKNPNICFEVDVMNDMANWQSVIAWGTFEELKDKEERKNGLEVLLKRPLPIISSSTTHLGDMWPFVGKDLNEIEGVVYRILLKEKTGRFEKTQVLYNS